MQNKHSCSHSRLQPLTVVLYVERLRTELRIGRKLGRIQMECPFHGVLLEVLYVAAVDDE